MLCGAASVSLRAASITKSLVAELNGPHKTSRFLCPAATFLLEPSALEWITKSPLGNICRYVLNYVHRWNLSTRLRKHITTRSEAGTERLLDGWSKRVSLVSRASLGVVADASVIPVNDLEFAALFILGIFCRRSPCRRKACMRTVVKIPVATHARALHGTARNMSVFDRLKAVKMPDGFARTMFANGCRDSKMNGAVRTRCCTTSVAVGPKFLHAEDILKICRMRSMLQNFIRRSQQEQVDN